MDKIYILATQEKLKIMEYQRDTGMMLSAIILSLSATILTILYITIHQLAYGRNVLIYRTNISPI